MINSKFIVYEEEKFKISSGECVFNKIKILKTEF